MILYPDGAGTSVLAAVIDIPVAYAKKGTAEELVGTAVSTYYIINRTNIIHNFTKTRQDCSLIRSAPGIRACHVLHM